MSVSDLRFGSVQALRSAAQHVPFSQFTRGRDSKGYYIKSYELDPIITELFQEMGVAVKKHAAQKEPASVVEIGPVQRVREWAHANPKATRDDAFKQFPELNPGTVRIQFSKARAAMAAASRKKTG